MGSGSWTRDAFLYYSNSKSRYVSTDGVVTGQNLQSMFQSRCLEPELDPYGAMRECRDSEEHPNTVPVIIGLDVTGSMGKAGLQVAKSISVILEELYRKHNDIEFMIMGIGDLSCDRAPIQISQFESDIRIADQLDKVYFELGGGGNGFESYTAAWYMGLRHTSLDCWKRGQKGIIITTGDEPLNPYLPASILSQVTGDGTEGDIDTKTLYEQTKEKFEIYHIAVEDSSTAYWYYKDRIKQSFGDILGDNLKISSIDGLTTTIVNCIDDALSKTNQLENNFKNDSSEERLISW